MLMRLMLTASLAVTLVSAQGKKGGGGGGGGMSGMGSSMPIQRASKLEEFADRLKLSKEQKEEVQTMLSAAMEQSAPLREQMDKGRVTIAGALIEGKGSDDVKKMLDDYTSLAAQMTALETATFTKVIGALKPNQLGKAASAFELLAMVMEHPAGGRPGGGGRRGR